MKNQAESYNKDLHDIQYPGFYWVNKETYSEYLSKYRGLNAVCMKWDIFYGQRFGGEQCIHILER